MADKLFDCAFAFDKLLNVQYNIKLGKRGRDTEFTIAFDSIDFRHSAGLHKLIDMPQLRKSSEKVFNKILDGKITYEQISKSEHFHKIKKRLWMFTFIEQFIDSHTLTFKYIPRLNDGTRTRGEFLLCNTINGDEAYLFIDKSSKHGTYYCRSFFPKSNRDYTANQPSYALLYKEKVNIITSEKIIQYDKITPKFGVKE